MKINPDKPDLSQWIPAVIIGSLGGLTLLVVTLVLNKFVFQVRGELTRTIITAIIFTIVFAVISKQWDKKTKG